MLKVYFLLHLEWTGLIATEYMGAPDECQKLLGATCAGF